MEKSKLGFNSVHFRKSPLLFQTKVGRTGGTTKHKTVFLVTKHDL